MSPYKAFLNNVRQYFDSVGILRFLMSIYIVVFSVGAGLFVLGSFLLGPISAFLVCLGTIVMLAGLLLTIIKEDMMVLVIVSGATAVGSLAAWIVTLVRFAGYGGYVGAAFGTVIDTFGFTSFFYFLAFGALATLVFIKADKFKQMRAASAARAQMAGVACPRCGGFIPMNAAFCPSCGAQNPAMQQYAAPVQPQYAPPAQPPEAAPAQPQEAPPAPAPEPEAKTAKCANCGADIPEGAAFCSNCGAKQ